LLQLFDVRIKVTLSNQHTQTKGIETMTSHIEIKEATSATATWSNLNKLTFHYFNDNGLVSQKLALNARIDALIASGTVAGGWAYAYGSESNFEEDQLIDLYTESSKAGKAKRIPTIVAIQQLQERVTQVTNLVNEAEA
tara:strand:- start:442 stop:858 length:417 start_codon:yes stop_codon:yes gene_type:complete